jgi:uncharacterized protein with PIN domain
MPIATFRFYDDTNDFLPPRLRNTPIEHPFDWKASIKDMIESLGVPHCEIEAIVLNGRSIQFDQIVPENANIEVYGVFESCPLKTKFRLREPLTGTPRFILDTHLGRLASFLRMAGYDTLYRNDYDDSELAEISHAEQRILLTRDIGLLKRSLVIHGRFIRQTDPKRQISEVLKRYNLTEEITLLQRCLKCNGRLEPVEKAAILDQITDSTALYYDDFHQCSACHQVYWKGSHYDKMVEFMTGVLEKHTGISS